MMFARNNKAQKVNCDTNIAKLEELTGKLPVLEVENEKFLKMTSKMNVINEIIEIFRNNSEDKAYGKTLECVLGIMESRYGVFGYIDSNDAFVCPSMTRNVWDKCEMEKKEIVFPREAWGESIWGRAIIEKKTLYSNEPFDTPKGHISIQRAMMVPIIYGIKVIGLFEIANKKTDYKKDDQEMLEQIANLISPILMARLQRDGMLEKGE